MLKLFIVIFRETLEIAVLLGIIAAATKGIKNRFLYINSGVLIGAVGALLIALFANRIFELFDGYGQELLQSFILFIAASMIIWTLYWMRKRTNIVATSEISAVSLVLVTAVSIFREGIEIFLFSYGVISSESDPIFSLVLSGFLGIILATLIGILMYKGILNISGKYLFKVTSVMLSLIAAGMIAQAANLFLSSQVIEIYQEPLWNSAALISQASFVGKMLHFFTGYVDNPTALELASYIITLLVIIILYRRKAHSRRLV